MKTCWKTDFVLKRELRAAFLQPCWINFHFYSALHHASGNCPFHSCDLVQTFPIEHLLFPRFHALTHSWKEILS